MTNPEELPDQVRFKLKLLGNLYVLFKQCNRIQIW